MSERIRVYEDGGGGAVIRREEDDPVAISQVIVSPEHRPAVALALLGGLTDELIERAAAAIWNPGLWEGHKIDEIDKELSRQDARHVLEAVFGAAIGVGGEGECRNG